MFANAVELSAKYTRPLVAVYHCADGKCRSGVGSFVVVNKDGWIVTAWHMDKMIKDIVGAIAATKNHQAQIAALQSAKLSKGDRKIAVRKLGVPKGDAPLAFAVWWSWDGVQLVDVALLQDADLLIGRLEPFDPSWIAAYPSFKDPNSPIRQGTSLCRLGHPFPTVAATYDAQQNSFAMTQLGLANFPNDGILTRTLEISQNPAGYRNRFIETSTPGLKGQSGGPIFDTQGVVWGIQSQTKPLSLGFDPEVLDEEGKSTNRKEHQFLNVGWGAHPETLVGFLKERSVAHTLVP